MEKDNYWQKKIKAERAKQDKAHQARVRNAFQEKGKSNPVNKVDKGAVGKHVSKGNTPQNTIKNIIKAKQQGDKQKQTKTPTKAKDVNLVKAKQNSTPTPSKVKPRPTPSKGKPKGRTR